jgi:hypothetical protein
MTMANNAIGPEFLEVSNRPFFRLGTTMKGAGDSEWMYVRANGAITGAGYVVVIDPMSATDPYDAAMITNTNGVRGLPVGVAPVAFADNQFGWVQIKGPCQIRTGVAVVNAEMATTTTAGELDDAAGTGTKEILGITLTTARTGSAGNTAGYISYPTVYVTN